MYYNIIKFPFSSVFVEESYILALCLNSKDDFTAVNAILAADTVLFTQKPTQLVSGDTVYNWEGTLTGAVKSEDDERDNMWEPLVRSKLSFNMAISEFPTWLMKLCETNSARVLLYKVDGFGNTNEMWRGYIVAQTLNMTVVDDKLSCPLVAVDEVAMSKYMNFHDTVDYVTSDHWCTVYGLMEHFHSCHHTRGISQATPSFEKLYTILGLSHSNRMLWHRELCVIDDYGDPVNNLPNALVVNLDRWLIDKEVTWETVLNELLEYLGVTFAVGSWDVMTVNDGYILACPTDSPTVQQFVFVFDYNTVYTHSTDVYATFTNPTKVGGNLQVSVDPCQYKAIKLTSRPERWEGHDYLTDEHYKPVSENAAVRFEWGEKENPDSLMFSRMEWHKLKYLQQDNEENEFLSIAPCQNGEGYLMAQAGTFPYVDINSCDGKTHPDASVANTLDFITFKEGCCIIKLGQGETDGIDEDKMLNAYFLIMNHMWGNMYRHPDHTMHSEHLADTTWMTLWPLGNQKPLHPADNHYLTLSFRVKFIRENMPSDPVLHPEFPNEGTFLYLKKNSVSDPWVWVYWSETPAILMPAEETYAPFGTSLPNYDSSVDLWYELYFKAYIKIGNYYYNGTTWEYVGQGDTPPKCDVTLWNSTNEIIEVDSIGRKVVTTANYYYTISMPYRGSNVVDRYTNSTRLLTSLENLSTHSVPMDGKLEIQLLGQIRFQNEVKGVGNSLPFVLINEVEITYTDEAELVSKDIERKVEIDFDPDAMTKEVLEKTLAMASPLEDGFFNNVLLYDDAKAWRNLVNVYRQGTATATTLEDNYAVRLRNQYAENQLFVEMSTPMAYDDNIHNVCFRVQGLTEASGVFLPVKREFNYTQDLMRVKLMRVNVQNL